MPVEFPVYTKEGVGGTHPCNFRSPFTLVSVEQFTFWRGHAGMGAFSRSELHLALFYGRNIRN
jgi:hypothetical protein